MTGPPKMEEAKAMLATIAELKMANQHLRDELAQMQAQYTGAAEILPEKCKPAVPDKPFAVVNEETMRKDGTETVRAAASSLVEAEAGRLEAAHKENEHVSYLGAINDLIIKVKANTDKLTKAEAKLSGVRKGAEGKRPSEQGKSPAASFIPQPPAAGAVPQPLAAAAAESPDQIDREEEEELAVGRKDAAQVIAATNALKALQNVIPLNKVPENLEAYKALKKLCDEFKSGLGEVDAALTDTPKVEKVDGAEGEETDVVAKASELNDALTKELRSLVAQIRQFYQNAFNEGAALRTQQAELIARQRKEYTEVERPAFEAAIKGMYAEYDNMVKALHAMMAYEATARNLQSQNATEREIAQRDISMRCVQQEAIRDVHKTACDMMEKVEAKYTANAQRANQRLIGLTRDVKEGKTRLVHGMLQGKEKHKGRWKENRDNITQWGVDMAENEALGFDDEVAKFKGMIDEKTKENERCRQSIRQYNAHLAEAFGIICDDNVSARDGACHEKAIRVEGPNGSWMEVPVQFTMKG